MATSIGPARCLLMLYALMLATFGLAMAVPGFTLLTLGGSPYYLLTGLAIMLTGGLLLLGKWRGATVYAIIFVCTVIWAVWEVGLDGWALVPRLVAFMVLGLPLLIASLLRRFSHRRGAVAVGVLAACAAVIGAIVAMGERLESPSIPATAPAASSGSSDWPSYGNTQEGTRYSPLAQINPQNVSALELAWATHIDQPMNGLFEARFEGTPLKAGDLLYACTGLNDIVALDAATGHVRWRFDAKVKGVGPLGICRGPVYYSMPGASGPCAHRIYTATNDARLLAIDAETGQACASFGVKGEVDLLSGLGQTIRGYYMVTSPPQLVRGKLVVGGSVADGQSVTEPSGVIRAFDAVTGKFAWAWDMGRPDDHGEPAPGRTYTLSTPNSWAPMSADEGRGLVYVPTGNATPDYFGANRTHEMETFSTSLVALDAETGAVRWHFQTVHHDVWDYDVSVQPTLIDLPTKLGTIPVVVQATKVGELFVLDRATGKPVFPVTERPVPQRPVAGDWLSPTQPHSALPGFVGEPLTERDMWGVTPLDQLWCRIKFREARYEGPFTPPGLEPVIRHPGYLGGTEWGSASYDPQRRLLVMTVNYFVNYDRLIPRSVANAMGLFAGKDARKLNFNLVPQEGTPYAAESPLFVSPTGTPCQKPPYSRINAIDLTTGKIAWSRPLGTARSLGPYNTPSHLPITIGTPTFGGAITTAGGLIFIGASVDHSIRAFETATGRLLWRANLPADGNATPMTYSTGDGRQFVVIGVGDSRMQASAGQSEGAASMAGGTIVAFALPRP